MVDTILNIDDFEEVNLNLDGGNDFVFTIPETTSLIFGTPEADILEIQGSNNLVFAGGGDDLIDAFTGSDGDNRLYACSGDDVVALGESNRAFGNDGDDIFFLVSGGGNIITGGEGADQFWITSINIPATINTITDFTVGEDVIGIGGLEIGFEDVGLTQQGDDALIGAIDSDLALLRLQNIDITSLSADDFTFNLEEV